METTGYGNNGDGFAPKRTRRTDEALNMALAVLQKASDDWQQNPPNYGEFKDLNLWPIPKPGLFRTPNNEAWVRVPVKGHLETHAVRSEAFSLILRRMIYCQYGSSVSDYDLKRFLQQLEAEGLYGSAPEESVHLRT